MNQKAYKKIQNLNFFQVSCVTYMTQLAPPHLTATAISIMATVMWVIGKGVRQLVDFKYTIVSSQLSSDEQVEVSVKLKVLALTYVLE